VPPIAEDVVDDSQTEQRGKQITDQTHRGGFQTIDADKNYILSTEQTAHIRLKAGMHTIILSARTAHAARAAGVAALTLKWSAPGSTQLQPIPAAAFFSR